MERCDTEEAVFQIKFPTKNNDQSKSKLVVKQRTFFVVKYFIF